MASPVVGTTVRVAVEFRDFAGALADPTEVELRMKNPAGVETDYRFSLSQVIRDSLGLFHVDVLLNLKGTWFFRYESTGALVTAGESHIKVAATQFG